MSCRKKNAAFRFLLTRTCGTCGKEFQTSADSPWVRQVPRDGKRQATTYYCSTGCFQASYKHIGFYDGKYLERKQEYDAKRNHAAKYRDYYAKNADVVKAKARAKYWENPEEYRERCQYSRQKRKLLRGAS